MTKFMMKFLDGVSIESASYMENNTENVIPSETLQHNKPTKNNKDEEYTPKLFSEDQNRRRCR